MAILLRLSLLFWTPLLILLWMTKLLARFFGWLLFERGRMTPFVFNAFHKFTFSFYFGTEKFHKYIVSSLDLKGDFMGKIYGLKSDTAKEFEPKGQDDVPAKDRLVFLCKFLDVNMSARITDQVYSAKGFGSKREELLRAGTQEVEILRQGLIGWKNFFYEDGSKIEWKEVPKGLGRQKAAVHLDENLNKIPPEIRGDIADFIRGSSTPDSD